MVEVRKGDRMVERNFPVAAFIEGILLCGYIQNLRDLFLYQVLVLAQVFDTGIAVQGYHSIVIRMKIIISCN